MQGLIHKLSHVRPADIADINDIAMMDTWCTPLRKILEHWIHLRIAFQKPSKDVEMQTDLITLVRPV